MPKTSTSGQGRRKGSQNKFTASVKEMIIGALQDAGGQSYLARQAIENPAAFMSLIGRVLPLQLAGDPNAPVAFEIVWGPAREPQTPVIEANAEESAADVAEAEVVWGSANDAPSD